VIKGTRWLLLTSRANVTKPVDRVRLRELLAANRRAVYRLRAERFPG